MTVAAFLLTNLNPDLRSRTHSLIYRSVKLTLLRTKPILDCNLNDPRPHLDRSDWYLNLVSDFRSI